MGDKDYRTSLSSPDFRILCPLYSVCTIKNLVSRSQTLDGYARLSLDNVVVAAAEGDERYSGGGIIHGYRTLSSAFPELCKTTCIQLTFLSRNYNSRNKFNREKLDAGGGPETKHYFGMALAVDLVREIIIILTL